MFIRFEVYWWLCNLNDYTVMSLCSTRRFKMPRALCWYSFNPFNPFLSLNYFTTVVEGTYFNCTLHMYISTLTNLSIQLNKLRYGYKVFSELINKSWRIIVIVIKFKIINFFNGNNTQCNHNSCYYRISCIKIKSWQNATETRRFTSIRGSDEENLRASMVALWFKSPDTKREVRVRFPTIAKKKKTKKKLSTKLDFVCWYNLQMNKCMTIHWI